MASIIKRERANKPATWQVQIHIANCKGISQTFDSEKEAKEFAELAELKARKAVARPSSRLATSFYKEKFATAVKEFEQSMDSSVRQKKLARTICRHIDGTVTGDIRASFVKAYFARMLKTKSKMGRPFKPNTIGAHIVLMNQIFKWRAEWLGIVDPPVSPFKTTLLPKGWDKGRSRRLSYVELKALLREAKAPKRFYRNHWPLLIRLAIETAARQQELAFAQWSEFDLKRGLWTIPEEHTKTKETRIVALSKRAKRVLKALWLLRSQDSEIVFHCFKSCGGISSGFRKMARKAGVKDFHFHDFRHEAISRMIARRGTVSPFLIMRMVGHKSTEMLSLYCNSTGEEIMGTLG